MEVHIADPTECRSSGGEKTLVLCCTARFPTQPSVNFFPPDALRPQACRVHPHAREKKTWWCRYVVVLQVLRLGFAVFFTRCSLSFGRAACQQKKSDHKTVMCAFTGEISWVKRCAGARRRSDHKHAVRVFTGDQRPEVYIHLFFFKRGVSHCQFAEAGRT